MALYGTLLFYILNTPKNLPTNIKNKENIKAVEKSIAFHAGFIFVIELL